MIYLHYELFDTSPLFPTDRPARPEGPLEVSDVHKEGCKLKWEKPKDDGGLPIDGYVVEKMDVTTGKSHSCATSEVV